MTATAKKGLPAWLILTIIVLVAAVLLVLTNGLTADKIEAQSLAAAEASRRSVMPAAEAFEAKDISAYAPADGGYTVDDCYEVKSGGETIGYTAQVTVKGYGGPIEIIVGVDTEGKITAVSIGGSDFSETAGMGAKVKEDAFRTQFDGLTPPIVLKEDIDAVTGATISSRAVTNGVNGAAAYIASIMQ